MEYLLEEGFTIYDGSYSIGAASMVSMAHVLSPETMPHTAENFRHILAGNGGILDVLRNNDYLVKSIHESDYFTKGADVNFDFSYPDDIYSIEPEVIIKNAILEGEFRFDADFSTLEYGQYLTVKGQQLAEKNDKPTFLYFHDNFPGHTQNSGVLLPGEREMIIERLEMANIEMKKILKH